ncbi:MAG TPA: dihydrofolate reductase [Tissierellaceae bacterium]|nr:dihydrofolate reductase [Tissierellaceae bacterium]
MILIFAVDNNWNIGLDGGMLTSIKEDLERFKRITEDNIVIMGRRTLEAIPGQKPLSNRINVLVTKSKKFNEDDFYILDDLNKLNSLLKEINPANEMEVFVTGGGSVVSQLMPYCSKAYITKILKSFPKADTNIPNLDLDENWDIVKESKVYYQDDLPYKYVNYTRK